MAKIIVYVAIAIAVLGSIFGYLAKIKHDAAQAEREKIRIELIAATNQTLAERRILDASFDKDDAHAFCDRVKLTWVFADGKSHCE